MSLSESSTIYRSKEALEAEISELKSMVSEFKEVQGVLGRLAEKVQHEIMVPLGPLAFAPGYIVNTNKVLMHLGGDLYAERTTFGSQKTIGRRLTQAEECLETMEKNLLKIREALRLKDEFPESEESQSRAGGGAGKEESRELPRSVRFSQGTAEIREEIQEEDLEKQIPPPLTSFPEQKPYIPDSHVEQREVEKVGADLSNLRIREEQGAPEKNKSKAEGESRPVSIFRQRMAEKR
ncbi:prefoldin like molecular chaperone [Cryptosporidium felis]|nr:prefoldin like molecular chaperone [Cryptosporidium felis]